MTSAETRMLDLLDRLATRLDGVAGQVETLLAESEGLRPVPAPTLEDFVPDALAACPPPSRRVWTRELRWLVTQIGDLPLDKVTGHDLAVLVEVRQTQALADPRAKHGRSAGEHLVSAFRMLFREAVRAGHIERSPAADVPRPRRPRSVRRALESEELAELFAVAIATSDDPELDELILWVARETAARRDGILKLRLMDTDDRRGAVRLREKGGHEREIPVSADLLKRLRALGTARGAKEPGDRLLRYRDGHPLTARRIDGMFARIRAELPWAARLGLSLHWLRHTTLSDVERVSGLRVARAYAGHAPADVTDLYTHVTFADLVEAHDRIFGTQR